jgi:hypothetical protein
MLAHLRRPARMASRGRPRVKHVSRAKASFRPNECFQQLQQAVTAGMVSSGTAVSSISSVKPAPEQRSDQAPTLGPMR